MVKAQHLDVLIVGAGLSGVGAAYRLQTECPGKTYAILEGRATMGGTWDLFRYPGVRSDSDMFTLGYPFNPWTKPKAIADGGDILDYIRSTATTFGIDKAIRYNHRVISASWSTADARWTVEVLADGESHVLTCSFLYLCSGYYSYQGGFEASFEGLADYTGQVVHPQAWPADLDYAGKRVVIIGSGATAVTLVPALARTAAQVTMLQRSPSWITALPATDPVADLLRKLLPSRLAHNILRWKNVAMTQGFYQFCRRMPKQAAKLLQAGVGKQLGSAVAVDPHFTPRYQPWDQRLCVVPNGDLFTSLRKGKATVVTDRISRFDATGIELASGGRLDADIVVTATGLKMVAVGELSLVVDGVAIDPGQALVYKGLMFAGIPNFAWCVGYTNASWTLRADLSARYVCRLINYLDRQHYDYGLPANPEPGAEQRPIIDLKAGYVQRAVQYLPKQGTKKPWVLRQNYFLDSVTMRLSRLDEQMAFGRRTSAPAVTAAARSAESALR